MDHSQVTHFPAPNAGTAPSQPAQPERRRKRKALSCYDCKRRKLKCDREQPACSRCIKGGIAESCTYDFQGFNNDDDDDAPEQTAKSPLRPFASAKQRKTSDLADHVKQLEDRLAFFECRANNSNLTPAASEIIPHRPAKLSENDSSNATVSLSDAMFIRVNGFKSQFYGPTKAAALIGQLPELAHLIQTAFKQHEKGARVVQEAKHMRTREKEARKRRLALDSSRRLRDYLPSRETTDKLVRTYFETLECLYRVLHRPQFMKEYAAFCVEPDKATDSFIVLVLLIAASVRCEHETISTEINGNTSAGREESIAAIEACERWLENHSQKHVTLPYFQAKILIFIAKAVNHIKEKREWAVSGSLFQFLLSSGFHRDPDRIIAKRFALTGSLNRESHLPTVRMTPFEQEMRRRLWATVVELELQTSIQRGMASMSYAYSFDTTAPSNVEDDDLSETSFSLPGAKAEEHFTATSYLHHSHTSLRFRISLNALLNDPETELSYEDVLNYEPIIMRHVGSIPSFSGVQVPVTNSPGPPGSRSELTAKLMLELQLRHYLLMLHGPFVRSRNTTQSRYSTLACIQAATNIITAHRTLMTNHVHSIALMRNDIFRSAMSLALGVLGSTVPTDDLMLSALQDPVRRSMREALDILTDGVCRLGVGPRELWVASAANALIEARNEPDAKENAIDEAIDGVSKVMSLISGMLPSAGLPTPALSAQSAEMTVTQTHNGQAMAAAPAAVVGPLPGNPVGNGGMQDWAGSDWTIPIGGYIDPFDQTQMTDWTFNDYWNLANPNMDI